MIPHHQQVLAAQAGTPTLVVKRLGGSGPCVLLLHGFGSDSLSWLLNQSALEGIGQVLALDLPGHGSSGPDVGDGALSTLTSRVGDAIALAGVAPLHWVGHSLGGAIALLLAHSRPERVASLTLIAPAGLGQGVAADFLAAYPELDSAADAEVLLRRLVREPRMIGRPLVARVLEQLRRPGARDALRSVAHGIGQAGPELGTAIDAIASSAIPRLVIWGQEDGINPLAPERLATFGGESFVVKETGHLPHIESARLVNIEMLRFLRQTIGS